MFVERALAVLCCMVVVDQVSAETVTLSASKDNTLYESVQGLLSNGAGPGMFSGKANNDLLRRAMLAFDLSSIPGNSTITGAVLTLNMSQTRDFGSVDIGVHRVLADWGEGDSVADGGQGGGGAGGAAATGDATWIHTFYDTSSWTSAGGDFTSSASATTSVGGTGSYDWTGSGLVADIQAWHDAPATNFGWIVIGDEVNGQSARRFDTREHGTPTDRPQLEITYEPETPIESATWGRIKGSSSE